MPPNSSTGSLCAPKVYQPAGSAGRPRTGLFMREKNTLCSRSWTKNSPCTAGLCAHITWDIKFKLICQCCLCNYISTGLLNQEWIFMAKLGQQCQDFRHACKDQDKVLERRNDVPSWARALGAKQGHCKQIRKERDRQTERARESHIAI